MLEQITYTNNNVTSEKLQRARIHVGGTETILVQLKRSKRKRWIMCVNGGAHRNSWVD